MFPSLTAATTPETTTTLTSNEAEGVALTLKSSNSVGALEEYLHQKDLSEQQINDWCPASIFQGLEG